MALLLASPPALLASLGVSLVGELGLLRLAIGRGVPDSRGGTSSRMAVGNNRIRDSTPGVFAKSVTDRRRGKARIKNSAGKLICLCGGRRERRGEQQGKSC